MKNDSKNIIKNQDGEFIALKERKLFEKIGYSLRQLIVALLCNITKPHTSSSLFYQTKQMKQNLKKHEIDKKVTDDILDDYIGEEFIDKQRFILIKEHFKKRVWFHGLGLIGVPFFFLWLMFPIILLVYDPPSTSSSTLFVDSIYSRPFFYASIFIISSVSGLFWRFYGMTWFLKGFEKDVIRYTLEKSLKKTDENKVQSVDGIALQYYNEEGLDVHELAKQVAKESEKGSK